MVYHLCHDERHGRSSMMLFHPHVLETYSSRGGEPPLSLGSGKNQDSWALDLELEDLKLLCPDGTEAGLEEHERCHLAAVPANAVVVRMEDKCRVWKFLERVQVSAGC